MKNAIIFKKDGWVFKIAHGYKTQEEKKEILKAGTNRCGLLWQFLHGLCWWLLIGIVVVVAALIFAVWYICASVVLFLVAKRVHIDWGKNTPLIAYPPIKKWPTFFGRRVYPVCIIVPGSLVWLTALYYAQIPTIISLTGTTVLSIAPVVGYVVALCAVLGTAAGAVYGFKKIPDTEVWKLAEGYLKDKKEKICTPVRFE